MTSATFLLALSCGVLLFWSLLALDLRRWWPSRHCLPSSVVPDEEPIRDVCVAVPARNEEDFVRRCLPSLLAQYRDFRQLIYVDDRSEDRTGEIARELVEAIGKEAAAEVIDGGEPRRGWSGKLHALERAVSHVCGGAGGDDIRWFLFTDADILHPPGSVRALRARADEGGYDVVSVMVRLRAESLAEKLLIPPFVYFFQLLYPFRRVSTSRSAAAAGGCLLVSRDLLERIGGLGAIRDAVIDDLTLARRARDAGGRLWLGLCPSMESLRAYRGLGDVAAMVSRTAFAQLRYSYLLLAGCWLALALFFVSPPVLCLAALAAGEIPPLVAAGGAWALQSLTLYPVVRHQRVAAGYALTLPFAGALYLWMTALSAWNHWRGRGVRWKGRRLGA